MRGYPKFLNSKSDYEYVKKYFPKYKWLSDFKALIDDRKKWMKENKLTKKENGIIDSVNKVVEEKNEKEEKEYYQYKFKVDPNCKLKRLGFNLIKIENIMKEQEAEMKK